MSAEIILMWIAVTAYSLGTIGFVFGAVFRIERLIRFAWWVSLAGLVPHAIAIGLRWVAVGHGPYLGFYEVVSSYAFASVIALVVASAIRPQLRTLGVVIMPLATLMIGGAMLAPKSPRGGSRSM